MRSERSRQRMQVCKSTLLQLRTLLVFLVISACGQTTSDQVVIFAAASLRDVATELSAEFERASGARVLFNFAGSNVLAQQIAAAPKADLFLSADERWIDFLENEHRTVPGTRRSFLRNQLVVIGHVNGEISISTAMDLATTDFSHLALADPESVPAGRYSRSWLASIPLVEGTLWDAVVSRVTPAQDVRAALALVESDRAIVGIVYASDMLQSRRARILFEPSETEQPPIVYGAVRIASERPSELAEQFLAFLFSDESRASYRRHGFDPPR